MTPEQKAAFIMAQVACAQAKVAAMQAENALCKHLGWPPKFTAAAFEAVEREFMIGHNDVIGFFRDLF